MELHSDFEKKQVITDVETWLKLCPPQNKDKQWVDYRSAKEMAKFWDNEDNQKAFSDFFTKSNNQIKFENGIPEMAMKFDGYKSPRKTDLAIFGKMGSKDTLISIEGKADEPYGENLFKDEFIQSIMTKAITPKSSKINRCIELFQSYNCVAEFLNIRYQLLHWLAGSIKMAESKNIDTIFLISQEFHSHKTTELNINRNKNDFDFFISLISKETKKTSSDNFIVGPFNNEFTKGINVFFGKYVTKLK